MEARTITSIYSLSYVLLRVLIFHCNPLLYSGNMIMALRAPSTASASKRNSARLDVLRMLLTEKPTLKHAASTISNSPRDSLCPLDEDIEDRGRSRSRRGVDLDRHSEGKPSRNALAQHIVESSTGQPQLTPTSRRCSGNSTGRATTHHLPGPHGDKRAGSFAFSARTCKHMSATLFALA